MRECGEVASPKVVSSKKLLLDLCLVLAISVSAIPDWQHRDDHVAVIRVHRDEVGRTRSNSCERSALVLLSIELFIMASQDLTNQR